MLSHKWRQEALFLEELVVDDFCWDTLTHARATGLALRIKRHHVTCATSDQSLMENVSISRVTLWHSQQIPFLLAFSSFINILQQMVMAFEFL